MGLIGPRVGHCSPTSVIVDCCHSPGSFKKALNCLSPANSNLAFTLGGLLGYISAAPCTSLLRARTIGKHLGPYMANSTPDASSLNMDRGKEDKIFNYCPSTALGKHPQNKMLCLGSSGGKNCRRLQEVTVRNLPYFPECTYCFSRPRALQRTRYAGRNKAAHFSNSQGKGNQRSKESSLTKNLRSN